MTVSLLVGWRLDDDGAVLLKYDNGASGVLIASQVAAGEENNINMLTNGIRRVDLILALMKVSV